ncbi:MAG TPA: hypothetical protein VHR66_27945 [Gemmataceae bacterium]|jgi:hypothetical protein|nr:hypothetical protein [Gemmataceae bacterium]
MHPSVRPYLQYFAVPAGFGPSGLRWSNNGEALETDTGTWRFAPQVAAFLEGFAALRAVPHFAHVVECLALLSLDPPAACPIPDRFKTVAHSFRRLNSPARNAGALFGYLCSNVPPAVHVPAGGGKSLAHWLTHSPSLGFLHDHNDNVETPSLSAREFHERVASRLRPMSDYDVRHWLRHGVAPDSDAAEPLAEELERRPPTMAEFLDAAVKDRSRLGDAVPLVRHFVSALSLPPRKRTPPKLPIGGYADVTNRGDPSRLLPSQLALDPDDFVRRFAENELLFFRREDPHERRQEHLALVVDQGVLTWGPVRLALGAAVLAFARLSTRRKLSISVRFGSLATEKFTLPAGSAERFGEALEASDLSAHPGHVLSEEVFDPSAPERDIVLLTHPRVVMEPQVRRATKFLANGCRLFALTVTEEGQVELVHVRDGGAVPISRFRIDFKKPAPKPPPSTTPANGLYVPWSGDVEPIPFPFRFGLTNRVADLAFDGRLEVEVLLAATVSGFLHAWTLADGAVEVLPRGCKDGQVMRTVQAVLGMANGFAVCGRLGDGLAVVHYDLSTRTATLHSVMSTGGELGATWFGFPNLHAVAVKAGPVHRGIDLGTGSLYPDPRHAAEFSHGAHTAVEKARNMAVSRPTIPVISGEPHSSLNQPFVVHDSGTGRIRIVADKTVVSFVPTSDGRPRFRTFAPVAQGAGRTLALFAEKPRVWSIHDLEDNGRTLAEYPPCRIGAAKLSSDGLLFVRQTGTGELTVTDPMGRGVALVTAPGRCHSNLEVRLGNYCMGMSVGSRGCLIEWGAGPLRISDGPTAASDFGQRARNRLVSQSVENSSSARFVAVYKLVRCEVGVDGFGQVAFVRHGKVECMFLYRRGKLSIWSPVGIRFGPPEITGGPETPAALEQLGEIMRNATA